MSFFRKNIDKSRVIAAIEEDSTLTSDERFLSKSLVWVLAETYAERDFKECEILYIEESFKTELVAGTIDLVMRVKNPIYLPKNSAGKILIVDWKTTNSSTFDKDFKNRYTDSWQWKIYSKYAKSDLFEYRCIGKSSGDTIEILLEPDKDKNDINVFTYLSQLQDMKLALEEYSESPWPKHMPAACNTYGKKCPFLEICQDNIYVEGVDIKEPLHYTSIETFLTCPERYRLGEIIREKYGLSVGETSDTAIGSAVHRGMAEIYNQIMDMQKNDINSQIFKSKV